MPKNSQQKQREYMKIIIKTKNIVKRRRNPRSIISTRAIKRNIIIVTIVKMIIKKHIVIVVIAEVQIHQRKMIIKAEDKTKTSHIREADGIERTETTIAIITKEIERDDLVHLMTEKIDIVTAIIHLETKGGLQDQKNDLYHLTVKEREYKLMYIFP
jgi:hypothetical protein